MANQYDVQIVEEGYRNAVVRIAGVLDTSDLVLAPAVTVSSFTNNDPGQTALVAFRVDKLQYAVDTGGVIVVVSWNSNTPQLIATLSDSQALKFKHYGGAVPNQTLSGFDGSINVETKGYKAGAVTGFTLVMGLIKLYQL